MSAPYKRNCKFCGVKVRMAQMDNGQWLPFDVELGGKHECSGVPNMSGYIEPAAQSKPVAPEYSNNTSTQQFNHYESHSSAPNKMPFVTFSKLMIAILLIFFVFLIFN